MCDSGICAGCRADQRRKKHGDYAGVVDIARNGIDRVNNLEKEVERLRARVAELESQSADQYTAELVELDGHAYGLRPGAARVVRDALRDAGRYRWLRHGDNDDEVIRGDTYGLAFLPRNAELDAAIDAAMAKGGA